MSTTPADPTAAGAAAVPPLFQGLFDDAAVFPPGNLPVAEAVPAHLAHRAARYADAVGPLLCGAGRLGELAAAAQAVGGTGSRLRVGLVLPGGSSELGPALTAAAPFLVAGVELATRDAREAVAALDLLLPPDVPAAVELPRELLRGDGLEEVLDVLVDSPYRAKFRTGGVVAGAFPDEAELAGFLTGCAQRGLPYKCTAGLHHAVRHTDPATGFEHHGFLNVLLAAAETDPKAAADILAERSGEALAEAARSLTDRQVTVIRNSFTAFGTCSIAEPLDDLAALGLLSPALTSQEDR
ncbi:hypothetical protein SAMN05216371_2040 [Streptomyces sp. TLI_053]|uniref:hypothetical protein n=1 Tax=Streptomyces sp. TLI_053 TaxID=1855352 RepID=UPI00087B4EB0|nr:hypothetical protein [Streptomyces sp. TLI_053]SDT36642.1 hypothetical protein SAMN05216371_2040 [Streptomyces sp. TLI_053]